MVEVSTAVVVLNSFSSRRAEMKSLRFSRVALMIGATSALLAGCSKGNTANTERNPISGPMSLVSVATPGTWPRFPTYDAVDYDKPGLHPPLTPKQVANIRAVLTAVKPCQRPLVRYSFGNGFRDLIMFFSVPAGEGSHVFGTADVVYSPRDGFAIPMSDNPNVQQMAKQGIQWDIEHQPCPRRYAAPGRW